MTTDEPWIDILDVSAAQGVIDFARVKDAQVAPGVDRRWRGVFQKVSEGETYKDPTRIANIAGARAVGMPFGVYVFIHLMGDIAKQVANAYEAFGDTMPSFGLMLDVESAADSLMPQSIVDRVLHATDEAYAHFGALPTIYSYPDFFKRRVLPAAVRTPALAELALHWAFYESGKPWYPKRSDLPRAPEPWFSAGKPITIWQYSGNTTKVPNGWSGHVDGVFGDVDRNVFTLGEDAFQHSFMGRPRRDQLEEDPQVVHTIPDFGRVNLGDDET